MEKRVAFMGTYIDALTLEETIERMLKIIENRKPTQHVVLNANKINLLYHDQKLKEIINHCGLINADGQSIVWADRLFNKAVPERVTGIDLFQRLIDEAAEKQLAVYYLGAEKEVVEKVVQTHRTQYPNLKIAGYKDGYFNRANSYDVAREISQSKPDILFMAVPSPEKEYWLNEYSQILNIPLLVGVGGSFDVIAGKTKRAPERYQKLGMEWFYRLIQEPRKMYKRYFIGNLMFIYYVFIEKGKKRWIKQ